jgi:hypothetical protein
MEMNDNQRLQLQNMIKANNVVDQTELIRTLRHSQILRNEVNNMILIKAKYRGDEEKIYQETAVECNFLFSHYTDIFNKIRKDEIDIGIFNKLIDVLRRIENEELDQHEGSFLVGTILKELYVDSAIKKGDKLDEQYGVEKNEVKKAEINVSWKQFKNMNN